VKYSKGVIAVALLMLIDACGSNAPKAATSPAVHPSTSPASPAPNLNSELLSVSDLPVGWSVVPTTTSGPTPKCLASVKSDMKATSKAEATFAGGSNGLPVLDEQLNYLPGQGQNAMTFVSHALAGCGHISVTSDGQTLTGTVGAMSFPAVADQSSAYQINLSGTVSGVPITLGLDLFAFRKADTVAIILYADLGTPDIATLQPIVQHAAAKFS
jgi:hypothetical protein